MATYGLSAHAVETPDKPALVLGDEARTFSELDARSTRLAHVLKDRGVGVNDRVAVMVPNSFEFFETQAAAAKVGAAVVPVNWHLKAEELTWILADSGAKVLVAHESLREQVGAAQANVPGCAVLVVPTGFEEAIAGVASDAPALEATTVATPMFYTSGTTGRPKGVVHGYLDEERSKLAQFGQVHLWWWEADDVHILSGPSYHAGPGGWTMTALFVGATTVILPAWDAREWLRLVDRHRVTRSFMVPAHFIRILELPEDERRRYDISSLRLIVHGGAPCPVEVKRKIIDALAPGAIWELYGASEGGATRIGPDEWLQRPGSVGLPWPGVEVRILDDDGRPVPTGQDGLVYVAPPGGAKFHYHEDEAKTDEAWRESAFTVGDIGHLDDDGYLYLTDRASDMVLWGGVNVYPREIEEVLHRHPAVVDCAVFGVADDRYGERLKAVVETRSPIDEDDLRAHCLEHLADFKCPSDFELVDALPRDPNGKVLKRLLREQASESA